MVLLEYFFGQRRPHQVWISVQVGYLWVGQGKQVGLVLGGRPLDNISNSKKNAKNSSCCIGYISATASDTTTIEAALESPILDLFFDKFSTPGLARGGPRVTPKSKSFTARFPQHLNLFRQGFLYIGDNPNSFTYFVKALFFFQMPGAALGLA